MNDMLSYEIVRHAARDRAARFAREAHAERLRRETRGAGRARLFLPALGGLLDRLRIVRAPAASRA